jgi:hypothetical protein
VRPYIIKTITVTKVRNRIRSSVKKSVDKNYSKILALAQCRVQIALTAHITTLNPNAMRTVSTLNAIALFFLPVAGPGVLEAGVVGVKTADGFERQELAAAFAADTVVGALGLTVPLPAKLQACALRFCDS